MTLHLNFPGSLSSRQAEQQQQQIREARKELKERVRNDWEYPTLPAHRSCGRRAPKTSEKAVAERVAGFRFHHASDHDREDDVAAGSIELAFEPTEWRERIYSSGSDSDDASNGVTPAPTTTTTTTSKKGKQKPYKFENPDSVGAQISERRIARKRRRQKALEDEMEWNDGLAHWMRRRDVWSCARTTAQVNVLEDKSSASPSSPGSTENDDSSSTSTTNAADPAASTSSSSSSSAASTSSSSPRTSTSGTLALPSAAANGSTTDPASAPSSQQQTPLSSPSTTPDLPSTTPAHAPTAAPTLAVLLPVAPLLLPNHPVRRRITPHLYPEIYSKVILQSRAPSVPLNLATLLRALVQGWKDDGEWPPKPAPAEKAIGRKKGNGHDGGVGGANGSGGSSSLRQGVRAMGRVLRWSGAGEHGKAEAG